MKRKILLALSVLTLTGCTRNVEPLRGYVDGVICGNTIVSPFNTVIECVAYKQKDLDQMMTYVNEYAKIIHQDADRKYEYNNVNNLYVINNNYGKEEVKVDQHLFNLLRISVEMCELTEGYFNPVIGSLVDLWEPKFSMFGFEDVDPSIEEITKVLTTIPSYTNIREIVQLNSENLTVKFNKVEGALVSPKISLSGIAKGYYIDILEDIECFEKTHRISAGSSSCSFAGENPSQEDKKWHIGLKHPDYSGSSIYGILTLSGNTTISTSGDSENYFINQNGIRRHHILNPYTGYSENNYRYVTLVCKNHSVVLDALSTALFNIDDESEMLRIVKKVEDFYGISIDLIYVKGEKTSLNIRYKTSEETSLSPSEKYVTSFTKIENEKN